MKGHVSVQGGVYSEGNVHTYKSKIEIDGEWYPIPDHIDHYQFKYLIQCVNCNYVDSNGSKTNLRLQWHYKDLPVSVIFDDENPWDYTPKDGDVFTGYGIILDPSKLIKHGFLTDYSIVWSKFLKLKTTSDEI